MAEQAKLGWAQFVVHNLGNIISTLAVMGGAIWFIGKPHAEDFIESTVNLKIAANLQEQIEEGKADREIIKTDQRTIKGRLDRATEERQEIKDDVKAIRRLLERRQ